MKSLLLAITFAFSASAIASTPASVAVGHLLSNGKYTGSVGSQKCLVQIVANDSAVSILIKDKYDSTGFIIVNSSSNYSVNDVTREIKATQKLNVPHYLQGATQVLSIVSNHDKSEIIFFITTYAKNLKGEELSTYATCIIER